jgi:hypothetical protein
MAQRGFITTRKDGRHPQATLRQPAVPDGIDAPEYAMKPSSRDPFLDRPPPNSQRR